METIPDGPYIRLPVRSQALKCTYFLHSALRPYSQLS